MDARELSIDEPRVGIRTITLERPERLNALTWPLVEALREAVADAGRERSVRAVAITGKGRAFCAGLDLKVSDDPVGSEDDIALFLDRQEGLAALIRALRALPIPVVAAVNGPAAGGGLAIALACDLRVAAQSARFNAAFIRIGLSACDMGVSYLLPRLVGLGAASEVMLTGRQVGADEALRIGLVNRVVPDGEALTAALDLAGEVIVNAPFAVRMTKEVLGHGANAPSLEAALALENRTQAVASRTVDQREALAAFIERRPASFTAGEAE